MAKETYAKARERLFRELPSKGYQVVTYNMGHVLKSPYVIMPGGQRVTFTPQSMRDEAGHSLWTDIRGMSVDDFDANLRSWHAPRHTTTRYER
jgi:hypothetical protein